MNNLKLLASSVVIVLVMPFFLLGLVVNSVLVWVNKLLKRLNG